MPTDRFVDGLSGDDAAAGTQAAPYRTIGRALTVATPYDTIYVEGDGRVYTESLAPVDAGLKLRAMGSELRPVMEGGTTRGTAISTTSATDLLILGFEIRNYRTFGIKVNAGSDRHGVDTRTVIEDNYVHHILEDRYGVSQSGDPTWNAAYKDSVGIFVTYGNPTIRGNRISHVGLGGESQGVMLQGCHNFDYDGNDVSVVRKEAIRASGCLGGRIVNNRHWLCWSGFATQQSIAILVANNFSYLNSFGLSAKHNNDPIDALGDWNLVRQLVNGRMEVVDGASNVLPEVRHWHNTVYESPTHLCYIAGNLSGTGRGYLYNTQYRNNLYGGYGPRVLYDAPAVRDTTVTCDYDVVSSVDKALKMYKRGSTVANSTEWTTLAQVFADSQVQWEQHGRELSITFADPSIGDLTPNQPIPGTLELPSSWGSQVGARSITPAVSKWKRQPVTVITATSTRNGSRANLTDKLGDQTTMATLSDGPEAIVSDAGSSIQFNHFRWFVYGHALLHAAKEYTLEIADSTSGPWTTIADSHFPDHLSSDYTIDLGATYQSRYQRLTIVNNFGDANKITMAEVEYGLILPVADETTPTSPPTNLEIPVITGTAQVGQTLTCSNGTWLGSPTSYAHQWKRSGVSIDGATSATYVPVVADVGLPITCTVTAGNGTLPNTAATSESVTPIAAAPTGSAPVNTVQPEITSRDLYPGTTASCYTGLWDHLPTEFDYQWKRGTTDVGTNSSLYDYQVADVGLSVTCVVTATNSTGSTPATSNVVVPVAVPVAPEPEVLEGTWGTPAQIA